MAATWLTKHGQEELPRVRGQGLQPRGATPRHRSVVAGKSYPASESSGGRRSYPTSEASGGREELPRAREELPCVRGQWWPGGAFRGVVAVQAQEGLEELSHVEGQEQQR